MASSSRNPDLDVCSPSGRISRRRVDLDGRVAAAVDRSGLEAFNSSFVPDQNDCVTICWTSGTESTPKGVPRTHYDWLACPGPPSRARSSPRTSVLLIVPDGEHGGNNGCSSVAAVGGYSSNTPFDLATFLAGCNMGHLPVALRPLDPAAPQRAAARRHGYSTCGSSDRARRHSPLALQAADKYGIEILNFTARTRDRLSGDRRHARPRRAAPVLPRYGHRGRTCRTRWPMDAGQGRPGSRGDHEAAIRRAAHQGSHRVPATSRLEWRPFDDEGTRTVPARDSR